MNRNELFVWLLYAAIGFLSGSVLFCKIIPLYILNTDICNISKDHNPGAANVFINCGVFWGLICLSLDLLKGYIPVYLAIKHLDPTNPMFAVVMCAPVLGHAIGAFDHFHGGKCIATAFGTMLALYPVNQIGILLVFLYILFSTILKIPQHRVRSMVSFGSFGIVSAMILISRSEYTIAFGCILISFIAFIKHTLYFTTN